MLEAVLSQSGGEGEPWITDGRDREVGGDTGESGEKEVGMEVGGVAKGMLEMGVSTGTNVVFREDSWGRGDKAGRRSAMVLKAGLLNRRELKQLLG